MPPARDEPPKSRRYVDLLAGARAALGEIEADLPRFETELLLMHAARWDRARLYLHLDEPADRQIVAHFRRLLNRRLNREPIAYITGHREFYGLDLLVDPRVLIPRPETEQLVEEALRRLTRAGAPEHPLVVDVGTGSGAVAVALAVHARAARIVATDASAGAIEVARQNAVRHGVGDRITLELGNLLHPVTDPVDLVVANLPYIADDLIASLPPEIRDFEPAAALAGGPTGLEVIAELLRQTRPRLALGGSLLAEIGAYQGDEAVALAARFFSPGAVSLLQDLAHRDRILVVETGDHGE